MIPNSVLEQLASASFDKAQVIIVCKMLLVTAENVRAQIRAEVAEEMRALRGDYGRLIMQAVEATEAKIFARLEEEKAQEEEKKRLKREQAAARKREREAAKVAASNGGDSQKGFFDDVALEDYGLRGEFHEETMSAPRMTSGADEQPVTRQAAAAFEDNTAYKELMAQWEAKAAADAPQAQKGSPMAAMRSLGEALVTSFKQEQERQQTQEAAGDMLMIEQSAPEVMMAAQ